MLIDYQEAFFSRLRSKLAPVLDRGYVPNRFTLTLHSIHVVLLNMIGFLTIIVYCAILNPIQYGLLLKHYGIGGHYGPSL